MPCWEAGVSLEIGFLLPASHEVDNLPFNFFFAGLVLWVFFFPSLVCVVWFLFVEVFFSLPSHPPPALALRKIGLENKAVRKQAAAFLWPLEVDGLLWLVEIRLASVLQRSPEHILPDCQVLYPPSYLQDKAAALQA